jgi:hypothetical protein
MGSRPLKQSPVGNSRLAERSVNNFTKKLVPTQQ